MGSHHSHEKDEADSGSGLSTPRAGSRRGTNAGAGATPRGSATAADIEKDKPQPPSLVPVEKLAKLLAQRSQKEDGVTGVTEKCFTKYLFPMYPELARHFFRWVHRAGKCKNQHVPLAVFRAQCERVLALLDDSAIIDTYVRMFSTEEDCGVVSPEGLRGLLLCAYQLSMDHSPEGPQGCPHVQQTLGAVLRGCFGSKESHSVGFVVRWLEQHCHRLIFPVHRYCVHMLATRHRDLEAGAAARGAGLELATPVLERSPWEGAGAQAAALLPVSAAWLLAGAAPPLYSRPVKPAPAPHAGGGLASAAWLARLVCALPSHWVPLYASNDHGLGANRFLHHTLAYRGPTLVVLATARHELVLVLCSDSEWRESHQYWGAADCALVQLQPTFVVEEHAPKMLYLNTSIRGYPRALRAGADPRAPLLDLDSDFEQLKFRGAPYQLAAVEVWGCGEAQARDAQLDVKKWQVTEAERQRQVKLSAADWMDHPDRYLLELAGRPQYNNSAS